MADPTTTPAAPAAPVAPRRLRWTPTLVAGTAILGVTVAVVAVASLTLRPAAERLGSDVAAPPSAAHWLGTDDFGHDLLARALIGAEASLLMALVATAVSTTAGVLIGIGVWTLPRRARELVRRGIEITVSYPELLIAIVIAAILGAGRWQLVTAVALANIPAIARLAANLAASVYQRDYVTTARMAGVGRRALITRHLLPNTAEPLLIQLAATFSTALVAMSALSFVGLGVQTPDYDLGRLLADGLPAIYTRPIEVVGPTLMIVLISVGAMLVGDGLAAAADPRAAAPRGGAQRAVAGPPAAAGAGTPADPAPADQAASTPATPTDPAPADPADPHVVSVRDLRVRRPDGTALVDGVSFGIGRGEVLGLVGESGSGKSLTALSLARLLPDGLTAEAAELRIDRTDLLGAPSARELVDAAAVVYQDPGTTFSPTRRMAGQLTSVLRVHRGHDRDRATAEMSELLERVHIVDPQRLLRARPYELSGGMRQRSMIAAALSARPALLIADEPTTALDTTVAAGILREIERVRDETGAAVLFISHDLGVVEELCDRVLVMKEGRIVEELDRDTLRAGEARHPYTRMLLDAVPRLSAGQVQR